MPMLRRIRDIADLASGPLENLVNANVLPLPQNLDDARELITRFVPACSAYVAVPSSPILNLTSLLPSIRNSLVERDTMESL